MIKVRRFAQTLKKRFKLAPDEGRTPPEVINFSCAAGESGGSAGSTD
jgi:hypothetical protein